MGSFADLRRRQRRLTILVLLDACAGREASVDLIYRALPSEGLASSVADVTADLVWLENKELIHTRDRDGITFAHITPSGADVAADRAQVAGVERPGP